MPDYRFYKIANGRILEPASDHAAPDDQAAVKVAKEHLNGHDIEIWQGPRLVAYLVPETDSGKLDPRRD